MILGGQSFQNHTGWKENSGYEERKSGTQSGEKGGDNGLFMFDSSVSRLDTHQLPADHSGICTQSIQVEWNFGSEVHWNR